MSPKPTAAIDPNTPQPESIPVQNGVAILYGYGLKVYVSNGHLTCEDGICDKRRVGRYHRAASGLTRLVITTTDGFLSLPSLQWLHDIGAGLLIIGDHGDLLLATAPAGCDYPKLRRAQALAPFTETGNTILRHLLQAKLDAQTQMLTTMEKPVLSIPPLPETLSDVEARSIEAQTAKAYWQAWQDVPLNFTRQDTERVPEHWHAFGSRSSHLNLGPRNATTPANAILNYCYAILEGETTIGLLTQGLDPGLGLLHTDQPGTLGLTYDVMEPARPTIDAWLYSLLQKQVFTAKDFWEDERGVVRMSLPLRRLLCQAAPTFRESVAPWVEYVATELGKASDNPVPTLLTQSNRSKGRAPYRTKPVASAPNTQVPSDASDEHASERKANRRKVTSPVLHRCKQCGTPIDSRHRYCAPCKQQVVTPNRHRAAVSKLAELRSEGADPAHGGDAAQQRGRTIAAKAAQRAQWEREHGDGEVERARYRREILPALAHVTAATIQQALDCSPRYASLIRSGAATPHPMHYAALERLITA